jgi:hypothetical protein
MPIYAIGRERESLIYSGEAYKRAVRKYLESLGYSQTTDSYIEGHFQDMVFVNSSIDPGRVFYVEAKASTVSLSQRDVCKEILSYLLQWLETPREKRFKFMIFVQEVSKRRRWDAIFGSPVDEISIQEWVEKNKALLSEDEWSAINKHSDILSFFQETDVYIGPAYRLEIAAEEKLKTSALSPLRRAKNLLSESERRNRLIEEKCSIVTNIFEVELPAYYTKIKTNCRTIEEIWEKIHEILLPPFKFDGKFIYSFCSYDGLNLLSKVLLGKPEYLETNQLLLQNPQELNKLVNFHIDKLIRGRGFRKYRDIYFLQPYFKENKIQDRMIKSRSGRERRVARPVFDILDEDGSSDSKLYYVYHKGVKVSSKVFWNKSYIQISPVRHFTTDGITAIEGENRDRLDRKYRTPIYNRSKNFLSWTKEWKYYLFEKQFEDTLFSSWFEKFKFGDFVSMEIIGVPMALDKDQRIIADYMEEDNGY